MGIVNFFLVRHGETTWNKEKRWQGQADVPLSEVGVEQVRSLARQLQTEGNHIGAVVTSPLSRAYQTADILAGALSLEPRPAPLWREMNIGAWSGLTTEEVTVRHTDEWQRIRAGQDLPRGGGETMTQFHNRIIRGADLLAQEHSGEKVLVVTHGGPIRSFILYCRDMPVSRYREVERIGNASLTEVVFQKGRVVIHRINDTAHLGGQTVSVSPYLPDS